MKQPLTRRQHEALQALKSFIEEKGYSPSLLELAEKLFISKVTTSYLVKVLIKKGYVSHKPKSKQDYQIINT